MSLLSSEQLDFNKLETQCSALAEFIASMMLKDQYRAKKELKSIRQEIASKQPVEQKLCALADFVYHSVSTATERQEHFPKVTFPESLPISERREEIAEVIRDNQVVILAGETGSGKTTQIPKICLSLGFGAKGLIGHTQPRRIAARTVASRIADELQTPLGGSVGYQVRFSDNSTENTHIKLMTDGILLAEIQQDPLLLKYEVLIIDEAHERSLNIDFLLGYLKQLLKKRSNLKIIVTSATIDLEKFSKHFHNAPIIEVSGRTFPVEINYLPWNEDHDDITDAIVHCIEEILTLPRSAELSGGDILIFLSGEREIRETSLAIKKADFRHLTVLPLYARLSLDEQNKIFNPQGTGRRVILATNVAETSITVPGIRYVIDPGTARISRYSVRTKVQRLPIEPISQASANQRSGRCGRVSNGICYRLYSREDFDGRPGFTDAEILRTNLAAVILQMLQLRIGEITKFPFVDKPDQRLINDGFKLLEELEAVDKKGRVTVIGRQLQNSPVDPRLGRMLVEAQKWGCINEVLIIISGLSIQDPRERPADKQQAADEKHRRFADEKSDFLSYVNLWNYLEEQRQELSQNQLKRLCKKEYINYLRAREWRELHHQIKLSIKSWGAKINQEVASYDALHRALLAGLLSNIGLKNDEKGSREYFGTRNRKFLIFPGSSQSKKQPKWLMASDFIETSQLFAHSVARIDVDWVLASSDHLCKKNYFEPHYDVRSGQVKAFVKITLFGLTIVEKKRVNYKNIDDKQARNIFIRSALVEGLYRGKGTFFKKNQKLISNVEDLEAKSRRTDILVDDEVINTFYQTKIPDGITNLTGFEFWRKSKNDDGLTNESSLLLTKSQLMLHEADGINQSQFPSSVNFDGVILPVNYVFEPGKANDGVNIHIPVELLHQISEYYIEWLVPGLLRDKCIALVKSLPKGTRKHMVPVPDTVDRALQRIKMCNKPLIEVLGEALSHITGKKIPLSEWNLQALESFYLANIVVMDDKGKAITADRSLPRLREMYRETVQKNLQIVGNDNEKEGLVTWNFGELESSVQLSKGAVKVKAFPALVDKKQSVDLRVLDNPLEAQSMTRKGICRLALLRLSHTVKYLQKDLLRGKDLGLAVVDLGKRDDVVDDILMASIYHLCFGQHSSVWEPLKTQHEFETLIDKQKSELVHIAKDYEKELLACLTQLVAVKKNMKSNKNALMLTFTFTDITQQLSHLFYKGFLWHTPKNWFFEYQRYLNAIITRLDKAPQGIHKDRLGLSLITDLWQFHSERLKKDGVAEFEGNLAWQEYRWMLEELRVSLFAQNLKTRMPVSEKRLKRQWETTF